MYEPNHAIYRKALQGHSRFDHKVEDIFDRVTIFWLGGCRYRLSSLLTSARISRRGTRGVVVAIRTTLLRRGWHGYCAADMAGVWSFTQPFVTVILTP